ncbi:MAG: hypothetical protein NC201_02725 [Prevotella sp.]|nr:hypothetical protein [Bacteroides sp.]MCM1366139.1 hypothetical protein [Prevotella sp.]MCM1436796.1 hypothetical protein [Prevotella sp.]
MKREMKFGAGDRVYARVMMGGRQVAEYVFDCVRGMSELITALRFRTRQLRGLANIYIRNITSGWSVERPLMFYRGRYSEIEDEGRVKGYDPRIWMEY